MEPDSSYKGVVRVGARGYCVRASVCCVGARVPSYKGVRVESREYGVRARVYDRINGVEPVDMV